MGRDDPEGIRVGKSGHLIGASESPTLDPSGVCPPHEGEGKGCYSQCFFQSVSLFTASRMKTACSSRSASVERKASGLGRAP